MSNKTEKPKKPFPEFPLFAHSSGVWAKKIKGQMKYFGPWSDPAAAKAKYDREYGSQQPAAVSDGQPTVGQLVKQFMDEKEALQATGDLTDDTYDEYEQIAAAIQNHLDGATPLANLTSEVFPPLRTALATNKSGKPYSPVTLKRRLTVARMIFAYANEMMGTQLPFKRGLQPPSARTIRQAEQARGKRMYEAAEIRKLVAAAPPHLKAMILLGINCGLGPDDLCRMPVEAIADGFHNFPRNKTSIERRCPLWPETQEAIAALPADSDHVFNGRKWDSFIIARQFAFCCEATGVKNLGFYSLRRTFQTIATTAPVNGAIISHIMGHARKADDMASIYRQQVFDSQLLECVNHVRKWYLGEITL